MRELKRICITVLLWDATPPSESPTRVPFRLRPLPHHGRPRPCEKCHTSCGCLLDGERSRRTVCRSRSDPKPRLAPSRQPRHHVLVYFVGLRPLESDQLFCTPMMALAGKTGVYQFPGTELAGNAPASHAKNFENYYNSWPAILDFLIDPAAGA